MIVDFFKGFQSPLLATMYVIRTPALWRHIILPISFMGACLLGGLFTLYMYASRLLQYLASFGVLPPSGEASLFSTSWFAVVQEYVIYYGAYIGIWILGIFMSYAIAIMVAPMLSEPISDHVVAKKNWRECVHAQAKVQPLYVQIGESLLILLVQMCCAIGCFFLGLIPVIGLVAPILMGIIAAFVLAKELLDVPLVRHGVSFSIKFQIIRSRAPLFAGFGCAVLLMAMIPLYNIVLFPIAVVSITNLFYEHIWSEHKELLLTTHSL